MITLVTAMKSYKNAQAGGEWPWLVEIYRDSTNVLRYTDSQTDITFDSLTWTKKAIKVQQPEQDTAGSVFTFVVQVSAVDKTMAGYIRDDEIIDQSIKIIRVHRGTLSDSTAKIEWRGKVQKAVITKDWVTLDCGPPNLRAFSIPARRFDRTHCQHKFKGPECGYAGAETSCDKKETTCRDTMSNIDAFGAFLGMPNRRS